MNGRCSKCGETSDRPTQRYCKKCHAAAQRTHRAKERADLRKLRGLAYQEKVPLRIRQRK